MEVLTFVGIIIYLIVTGVCFFERCDEIEESILWPLVFIKFLLKALFKVVFTGWRY